MHGLIEIIHYTKSKVNEFIKLLIRMYCSFEMNQIEFLFNNAFENSYWFLPSTDVFSVHEINHKEKFLFDLAWVFNNPKNSSAIMLHYYSYCVKMTE